MFYPFGSSRIILVNSCINNCLAAVSEGICISSKHRSWPHSMLQYYANNFLLEPSLLSQTLKSTKTALNTFSYIDTIFCMTYVSCQSLLSSFCTFVQYKLKSINHSLFLFTFGQNASLFRHYFPESKYCVLIWF